MKERQPFMSGDSLWKEVFEEFPYETLLLNKGDIYRPDEHENQIALLVTGLMKVFLSDAYGEERFMWIIEPFSLIQWNHYHNFSHSLIAIEHTSLYLVDKNLFTAKVRLSANLFDAYIHSIYQKYTYCVEKLIVTDIHNSQFKVYSFLLHLAYRYGTEQKSGEIIIENIITRQDISSITGVHRVNIIKYLHQLEDLKIIEKDRKRIHIKNVTALENLIKSLDIQDE